MTNEFKKIKQGNVTRYVLETATVGSTSAGAISTSDTSVGEVQARVPQKPRQGPLRQQTGGGAHRNKKKEQKQGKDKHRKPFAEQSTIENPTLIGKAITGAARVASGIRPPSAPGAAGAAAGGIASGISSSQSDRPLGQTSDIVATEGLEPDHEISMASNELKSIIDDARKLLMIIQRISEVEGLEAWQQSKITKATDYIASVLRTLQGENLLQQGVAEADPLGARGGIAAVNRKPRAGQTDFRSIAAGNHPESGRTFSDQDRQGLPGLLKARIKSSLGKHTKPKLPDQGVAEGIENNIDSMSIDELEQFVDSMSIDSMSIEELEQFVDRILPILQQLYKQKNKTARDRFNILKKPYDAALEKIYNVDSMNESTLQEKFKSKQGVAEGQGSLIPGKFYVVGQEYGRLKAVKGPFDDDGEAEYEKAEYSGGGKRDAAVAQWTGRAWNFDSTDSSEQGVAEGYFDDDVFIDKIVTKIEKEIYDKKLKGEDALYYLRVQLLDQALEWVGRHLRKNYEPYLEYVENWEDAKEFLTVAYRHAQNKGMAEGKIKGVDGKACWKGKRYAGKVKKADGTYKDKCVPVGKTAKKESKDIYLNSLFEKLDNKLK